jgi:hypothetical protein
MTHNEDSRYYDIVFMQGDEAYDVLDKLCHVDGVVVHGADDESIRAAVDYLSQWDYGDESEHTIVTRDSFGRYDDEATHGEYLIGWNYGLSYVYLARLVEDGNGNGNDERMSA